MKHFNKILIVTQLIFTYLISADNADIYPIDPTVFVNPEKSLDSTKKKNQYNIGRNLVNGSANSKNDVVVSRNSSKEITFHKKEKSVKKNEISYNFDNEKALLLLRAWDANNQPKVTSELTIITQKYIDDFNDNSINVNKDDVKKRNNILAQKNTFDAICYIPYTLKFSFVSRNVKLHCKRTDTFSKVKINVKFTPKNESFILLGTPYAYEIDGSLYQANIDVSEVTNSYNSDFNIATSVNTQAVQTAIDAAAEAIGKSIGRNADRYVSQLEASRQKQNIYGQDANNTNTTIILNPTVVKSTNTEKPEWKDYAISAAIGGLGDAISNIASQLKTKYPYLYEIQKGTTLYVKVVPKY